MRAHHYRYSSPEPTKVGAPPPNTTVQLRRVAQHTQTAISIGKSVHYHETPGVDYAGHCDVVRYLYVMLLPNETLLCCLLFFLCFGWPSFGFDGTPSILASFSLMTCSASGTWLIKQSAAVAASTILVEEMLHSPPTETSPRPPSTDAEKDMQAEPLRKFSIILSSRSSSFSIASYSRSERSGSSSILMPAHRVPTSTFLQTPFRAG